MMRPLMTLAPMILAPCLQERTKKNRPEKKKWLNQPSVHQSAAKKEVARALLLQLAQWTRKKKAKRSQQSNFQKITKSPDRKLRGFCLWLDL
jgi:hypothetical protein